MFKYYSPRVFRFFAVAIIASLCLLFDVLTRINFKMPELPKDKPEYNAVNVDGKVYNKQGKLLYKLISKTAWEFPNDERIYMTDVQIFMYDEHSDVVKYYLTSKSGWVNYSKKLGQLGLDTELTVNDPIPQKNIRVYGKNINFNMEKNLFESVDDIKAVQDRNVVTAHGFSFDYNKQFLTLNSKVSVTYVDKKI